MSYLLILAAASIVLVLLVLSMGLYLASRPKVTPPHRFCLGDFYIKSGRECIEHGDFERAILECDKAQFFAPNHIEAILLRAAAYEAIGNEEMASRDRKILQLLQS